MKQPRHPAQPRGIALIGVLIALFFLSALVATLATKVVLDTQLQGTYAQSIVGFHAAESALNRGMGEFRQKFLDYLVPTGSDFNPRAFEWSARNVTYQLVEKPGNPRNVTIPAGQLFAGLNSLEYGYTVRAKAVNQTNGDEEASVGAEFLVGNIPLFQFVAFYDRDLEILPGPTMSLRGRVHTNGDLYLGSGNTLTIEDDPANGITTVQVSAAGRIFRGRKNDTQCTGTVVIDKLEDVVSPFGDLDPLSLPCVGSTRTQVSSSTLAAWKGSIISGMQSVSVPRPDMLSRPPQGAGLYWTRADLRIALVLNTPGQLPGGPLLPARIEVQDASGNQDAIKTALLYTFMSDPINGGTYANGAPSSLTGPLAGTRPIYYTEVPVTGFTLSLSGATTCTCSDTAPNCNNTNPSCYPQMNSAGTALAGNRYIGCPAGTGTCNNGGQALNANPFNRTYGSNNFVGTGGRPGMLGDLDYRRGGFYNWRERRWMYLLNVNVADLLRWNAYQPAGSKLFDNADTTDGGLVLYLTVVGPNSSSAANNYGVRVFGSRNLWFPTNPGPGNDPTGITIVSDQAMYIQGDFNQGNNAAPPYGTAGAPASNLPKQPAAFLADSINILSNAYFDTAGCKNDCQSNKSLTDTSRRATTTWIHAGFLAGVDDTTSGNYNGGLENYPRFHEDWSGGATFYYRGSFVSLGTPLHVNGRWCGTGGSLSSGSQSPSGCNIYNPPVRDWNYDPFFNNAANLPPLTPRFVYVQQVLFTEDFL
jgi:hypothetical protein